MTEQNVHFANSTIRPDSHGLSAVTVVVPPPQIEEMRAELTAVLSSKLFRRAPTLVQFLSYVCEKYFRGQAEQIKEYTVAVEAFGRPDTFEPKRDPIVRVDANRLRRKLMKYYRYEGRNHSIRISLPAGQYVPVFEYCDQVAANIEAVMPTGGDLADRSLLLPGISATWPSFPLSQAAPLPIPASAFSELPLGEVRILCGNSATRYLDQVGRTWTGDRFFSGGQVFAIDAPIARSEDPVIWQKGRQGDFSYNIPLKPGIYELRLYFAEPVFGIDERGGGGETNRIFDVLVNGKTILDSLDIIADAGGARTADVKVLPDVSPASDGYLHLQFRALKSKPLLNAVELVPGIPGRIRAIQITTSSYPIYASDQTLWGADRYFIGGRRVRHTVRIAGTDSPQLYGSERFGNFSYCIPVAPGRYTVRLHFREAWFGPGNAGKGGRGSRLFDVYCNGLILLKNLDIFAEAGGAYRALIREFRGLRANPQGKLILSFQPTANYACISALEVIQEAE